ncbi:hypothetical protein B0A50_04229 [Salinomyces thailandicus]|uniref:Late endosomal/lysosomal adaptor and MAPK and MTOR activator-domain-containing protein n=1 Tax=Salinomyces thailandicus TaxID=706561 RepID=A0A4U0TWJ4_9PEZI|nr:hypothetical protein B0A50_04229 [Salinomyces thailandica]
MGICASCLGLNRHPSHDIDETDALLDDSQPAQYGSAEDAHAVQPDEEELRRQREALEQITAEAAENMIDVSQHHTAHSNHDRQGRDTTEAQAEPADAEEAAWLQSIHSAGLDSDVEVKGLQSGALVMDLSSLRQDARKTVKSSTR